MPNNRPNWMLDEGGYLKHLLGGQGSSVNTPFTGTGESPVVSTPFIEATPLPDPLPNPLPDPPEGGGLAKWFADKGNMNMLGTAATGLNMVTGLVGTLSNLETAGKQRKLLDQQLAHNKTTMNNRKQLINQLKGSY